MLLNLNPKPDEASVIARCNNGFELDQVLSKDGNAALCEGIVVAFEARDRHTTFGFAMFDVA